MVAIFVGFGVLGWVIVVVVMMNEVLVQRRENFWFLNDFFFGLINLGSIFNPTKLTKHLFNFEKHDKTFFSFSFSFSFLFFLKNKLLKTEGKNGYQTCSNLFIYFFFFCFYSNTALVFFLMSIKIVRTSFDSNPKTGMDSGPTSPNNKFVESGRKS